jgi:hypothetical protein
LAGLGQGPLLPGIEHERFSVKHQGLDMRLTGVEHARLVKEILV